MRAHAVGELDPLSPQAVARRVVPVTSYQGSANWSAKRPDVGLPGRIDVLDGTDADCRVAGVDVVHTRNGKALSFASGACTYVLVTRR
jgi:hypothetical protein